MSTNQYTKNQSDALAKLLRGEKSGIFSVNVGCAECGTRLRVRLADIGDSDYYQVWATSLAGDLVYCADCADRIFRSAISGDRSSEMTAVRIDGTEDLDLGDDSPAGWITLDELGLVRSRVSALQDEGADVSLIIDDEAQRIWARIGGRKTLNQGI